MRILVVHSDAGFLVLLNRTLTKWGHVVFAARNDLEALELVRNSTIDALISDWGRHEPNGSRLWEKINTTPGAYRETGFQAPVYTLLMGNRDVRVDFERGVKNGMDDYIAQPFEWDELRIRLEIANRRQKTEQDLNQSYLVVKRNYYQVIQAFIHAMDACHPKLGAHCRRVGQLALELAKSHVDATTEDYPVIEAAAMLHDIGLVGLRPSLITKKRIVLTGEEVELYRTHSERGEKILNQIDLLKPVARLVRMHHEQFNGRGFPDGLGGDQIPINARIIAAASIYDGLIHQEKIPLEAIPEVLQQYRGYQIDPYMVDLLLDKNMREVQKDALRKDREIDVNDLEPGMVLAHDVRLKTGAFVMAADAALEPAAIAKLKRYHELGNLAGSVFIRK